MQTQKLLKFDEKTKSISNSIDNDAKNFEIETSSLIQQDHQVIE